jgi:hypothetical protein
MAKVWTFNELRTKVNLDCDTQDETFITFDEMCGYTNEAIDEAEAEIHKIDEEYFLQEAFIATTAGTAEYALPSDIYGQKIRAVISQNGTDIYEIARVQRLRKFLSITLDRQFSVDDTLRYFIKHGSAADDFKIVFVPTPTFSTTTRIKMWYLRNANRVPLSTEGSEAASNATKVDIPEFANYILAFMKERVLAKEERGSVSHQAAAIAVANQKKMMTDTLSGRFVDDDDEIWKDLSSYSEQSSSGRYE